MEEEETIDFKLKVFQGNINTFFEVYKQLDYKAYINMTVATFLFATALSVINKVDSYQETTVKVLIILISILFLLTVFTIVFSIFALIRFNTKDFLYYDFFNLNNINDLSLLKESLLSETLEKTKGLVERYNNKNKYIIYGTYSLLFELGFIVGALFILLLKFLNII